MSINELANYENLILSEFNDTLIDINNENQMKNV